MAKSTLRSGPWKSVYSTTDPWDDAPDQLVDALNIYIPDSSHGSGAFQRPAFTIGAGSSASLGTARATGQFHFTSTAGVEYNYVVVLGKLYKVDSTGTATDITPAAVVTIDNTTTTRCFMAQLNDTLIFTDGVNRPWVGTNLSATPITGAYIDADGAAGAWTAYGAPFIQAGCVGFILKTTSLAGMVARLGLIWSEPNSPTVGYLQTSYTDWWNVIQTSTRPITAVVGRNDGILIFRDRGIGFAAGNLSGSFSAANTTQLISDDIGLLAPATIGRYKENTFFADQFGRPQLLEGLTLREPPIWMQMRTYIDSFASAAGYQTAVTNVAIGVIEPNLNLYLVAPFASGSLGVNNTPPTTIFAFDAKTGVYIGRWTLASGFEVTSFGVQLDANLAQQLWVLGPNAAANGTNRIWQFQRLSAASWSDTTAQTVSVTTGQLGYAASLVWDAGDLGTLITMGPHAVAIAVQTPYMASTAVGTATPATSADGTYRCVVGLDIHAARGISVTATPTLGATQWGVQRWEMLAVSSVAGPGDA